MMHRKDAFTVLTAQVDNQLSRAMTHSRIEQMDLGTSSTTLQQCIADCASGPQRRSGCYIPLHT